MLINAMQEMDNRGIFAGEVEVGRDAKGGVKLFDLSMAERRNTEDQNYSTVENNIGRIKRHLSEEDKKIIDDERQEKFDKQTRELLNLEPADKTERRNDAQSEPPTPAAKTSPKKAKNNSKKALQKAVSQNMHELSKPGAKRRPQKQKIAIAISEARRKK